MNQEESERDEVDERRRKLIPQAEDFIGLRVTSSAAVCTSLFE